MSETKTENKTESRIAKFFKGVQAEFKKIIWPERDTIIKQTIAVVIVSFLTGAVIALLDYGFQHLVDFLTTFTI